MDARGWGTSDPKRVTCPPLPLRLQNRGRHRRHNCRRQRLWRTIVCQNRRRHRRHNLSTFIDVIIIVLTSSSISNHLGSSHFGSSHLAQVSVCFHLLSFYGVLLDCVQIREQVLVATARIRIRKKDDGHRDGPTYGSSSPTRKHGSLIGWACRESGESSA